MPNASTVCNEPSVGDSTDDSLMLTSSTEEFQGAQPQEPFDQVITSATNAVLELPLRFLIVDDLKMFHTIATHTLKAAFPRSQIVAITSPEEMLAHLTVSQPADPALLGEDWHGRPDALAQPYDIVLVDEEFGRMSTMKGTEAIASVRRASVVVSSALSEILGASSMPLIIICSSASAGRPAAERESAPAANKAFCERAISVGADLIWGKQLPDVPEIRVQLAKALYQRAPSLLHREPRKEDSGM
mmetsp:Transcript_24014/g.61317  ORF Transcript_24014/g.61317 Transcript_24014/m.61317 type:complete len:245 (-) Transcript_24014:132-866(-)